VFLADTALIVSNFSTSGPGVTVAKLTGKFMGSGAWHRRSGITLSRRALQALITLHGAPMPGTSYRVASWESPRFRRMLRSAYVAWRRGAGLQPRL
jgi:hypothetical protein